MPQRRFQIASVDRKRTARPSRFNAESMRPFHFGTAMRGHFNCLQALAVGDREEAISQMMAHIER